jgi:Fe-S-cluster containining protein
MLKINCNGCSNSCCNNPSLTPVLLASEEELFLESLVVVETPFRNMRVLRKRENGSCVFLDDEQMLCTTYSSRPLECRIYPYLLDFSKGSVDIKLDERFCPSLSSLQTNINQIRDYIRGFEYPSDWISAYDSMQGNF